MAQPQIPAAGQAKNERGYVVRIELHGIERSQDYMNLRKHMLAAGFQVVISNRSGVHFKLPTATYYHPYLDYMPFSSGIHELALTAVRKALASDYLHVQAANGTSTILVAYASDVYWTGLELADE